MQGDSIRFLIAQQLSILKILTEQLSFIKDLEDRLYQLEDRYTKSEDRAVSEKYRIREEQDRSYKLEEQYAETQDIITSEEYAINKEIDEFLHNHTVGDPNGIGTSGDGLYSVYVAYLRWIKDPMNPPIAQEEFYKLVGKRTLVIRKHGNVLFPHLRLLLHTFPEGMTIDYHISDKVKNKRD